MDGRTFGRTFSVHGINSQKSRSIRQDFTLLASKFRGADGKTIWRSTKQIDHQKAIAVARKWEKAARLAASSELTQAASIRLLDELMETTIGEKLNVRSVESYFAEWFKGKKATGTSPGTLTRYRPVLEGFIASLSEQRRRASVASITALEVERFRDGELEGGLVRQFDEKKVGTRKRLYICIPISRPILSRSQPAMIRRLLFSRACMGRNRAATVG
jgi:hypothetical protein